MTCDADLDYHGFLPNRLHHRQRPYHRNAVRQHRLHLARWHYQRDRSAKVNRGRLLGVLFDQDCLLHSEDAHYYHVTRRHGAIRYSASQGL